MPETKRWWENYLQRVEGGIANTVVWISKTDISGNGCFKANVLSNINCTDPLNSTKL